jgi:hypothetical protein
LSWTHNLFILGKCKRDEEREFYLRLAAGQKWTSRNSNGRSTAPCSSELSCHRQNCQRADRIAPRRRHYLQGHLSP